MANALTLTNLQTHITRLAKQFTGAKSDMIGHLINMVYLSEILVNEGQRPFHWLLRRGSDVIWSLEPSVISGVTKANPGVFTTSAAHGLTANVSVVELCDVEGMTEVNGAMSTVASTPTTTTFTTAIDTTNYSTYSSGGRVIHRGSVLSHDAENVPYASFNGQQALIPLVPKANEENIDFHNNGYTGIPTHFSFDRSLANDGTPTNQVTWYPGTDNVYRLRYWYEQVPDRLEDSGDVPMLPFRFHGLIVTGVMARLAESKENVGVENASIWPSAYATELEALRAYNDKYWANMDNQQVVKHYLM